MEPASAAANLNLGMLLAEMGRMSDAEAAFRTAIQSDPQSAQAAYNLGVLLSNDRPAEALDWCRRAAELGPDNPRFGYAYAFYLHRAGRLDEALQAIRSVRERFPANDEIAAFEQSLLREQKPAEKKPPATSNGPQP